MATIDKLKMLFGFALLAALTGLGFATSLGHVHQDASYGFDFILGTFTTMGGAFSGWAFGTAAAARKQPQTGGESEETVERQG